MDIKYYIDLDGPNNPGPPFEVFCDFAKNRTLVPYAEQKSRQIKIWILNRSGSCWQDFTRLYYNENRQGSMFKYVQVKQFYHEP